MAVILEVLYQRELIDEDTYSMLSQARRARNALAHRGSLPTEDHATAALL